MASNLADLLCSTTSSKVANRGPTTQPASLMSLFSQLVSFALMPLKFQFSNIQDIKENKEERSRQQGTQLDSSHSPKPCRLGVRRLIGHSKLPVGVKVSGDGCLCLCVSPVTHRHKQPTCTWRLQLHLKMLRQTKVLSQQYHGINLWKKERI